MLLNKPSNQGAKVNHVAVFLPPVPVQGAEPGTCLKAPGKADAITLAGFPSHAPMPASTSLQSALPPSPGGSPLMGTLTSLVHFEKAPLWAGQLSQPSLDHPPGLLPTSSHVPPSSFYQPPPQTHSLLTQNLHLANRFPPFPNFHPSTCSLWSLLVD